MKQAFLGHKTFHITDREIPQQSAREVIVKTVGCGVCEGDLFRYSTSTPSTNMEPLGHEASGVITAVGSAVTEWKVGDAVTALGGAYADYFVIDESMLVAVPTAVPLGAALGEPLACCVHAATRFNIGMGDRVAIIGCGFMGLCCLQLAYLQGAREIIAIDPIAWRLEVATSFGATAALHPDAANDMSDSCDVVIEASGVAVALTTATDLIKQHGTLNIVGYHQSDNGIRHINMQQWNYKALTVNNSHVRNESEKRRAMDSAMRLYALGALTPAPLITDYALDDINLAFADLTERKQGLFKANIIMEA